MTPVALIGCGGIAQDVLRVLRSADDANRVRIVGALARPGRTAAARSGLGEIDVVTSLDELLSRRPALVAEVAGQGAVVEHGEAVLRRGVDLLVISIGALADTSLLARLRSAAEDSNSRIMLPAGAIGGIDAIAAMRLAGLATVRYRSRKPPAAWRHPLGLQCGRGRPAAVRARLWRSPQLAAGGFNVAAAVRPR